MVCLIWGGLSFIHSSRYMEMILSAVVLLAGLIAGFFIGRMSKGEVKDPETDVLRARMEEQKRAWQLSLTERERGFQDALDRQRMHDREQLDALQNRFDETVARMQSQLQAVTARLLRERQEEFQATSSERMRMVLDPLNETIAELKKTMADNTRSQSEFSGIFSSGIAHLMKQSEAARMSADRLADALSHNTKIQGEWGETVLTELLESQGLKEGVHFDTQVVMGKDSNLRPDLILHLDRERDVVIDSKVSLSAYLSYMNAETDDERAIALKAHILSIENHVKELVRKDYTAHIRPPHRSVGYVIMFVPNTTALLLATSAKPELWRKAMEQNVYIADEQTLYAALKIVHLTWTQIAQTENHQQVYALANEMLDRVGKFMEKYMALGKAIETLGKTYDDGMKKIQEDGHSVPQTCRKLIRMGAKMERRKGVPDTILGLDAEKIPDEKFSLGRDSAGDSLEDCSF